jgi:hypothetical protein
MPVLQKTIQKKSNPRGRQLSEKKQTKYKENPFFAAQVYEVADETAVENDTSAFGIYPKDGRIIVMSKTNFFNFHRTLPLLSDGVLEGSEEAVAEFHKFIESSTADRKKGLNLKSIKISKESITELDGLLQRVGGCDEAFAEFCTQKCIELNDDGVPDLDDESGKKGRPKISDSVSSDYYTRGQAIARFITAILSGELTFGKKMNTLAKAFVTKFAFDMPDTLPECGSDAAKTLFDEKIASRLLGYCDSKILSVLHHEDGLPIYQTEEARQAVFAGNYPVRTIENGNPVVPKFDMFFTFSFEDMPLHNEWSCSLDERCCIRVSTFMYDIIKRAAFALLGNMDTWPAALVHFFKHNEKNNSIDEVALAKAAYAKFYSHIASTDTDKEKKDKAADYIKRPYRNPSNSYFYMDDGATEPTTYDQTVYFGSDAEKAHVKLQFHAVGTHDADDYTAAAFKAHKDKSKTIFTELWKLDGALSKNSMFKAASLVLRGARGAPEVEVEDDGNAPAVTAGRTTKARRTNASMATEISELKAAFASFTEATASQMEEMKEMMAEMMKNMIPAPAAAP